MDASTLAALAAAMDESRAPGVRELLQDRERAATANEDARSFLGQRHYTASQQEPDHIFPRMTWEAAYTRRHNDLLLARDAMRAVLRAVRQGHDQLAEGMLAAELGPSSEEEEEEEEEEDSETSDEEALVCVLCERRRRRIIQMAPRGRWAGLVPDARLVCNECHTEAMGPIE